MDSESPRLVRSGQGDCAGRGPSRRAAPRQGAPVTRNGAVCATGATILPQPIVSGLWGRSINAHDRHSRNQERQTAGCQAWRVADGADPKVHYLRHMPSCRMGTHQHAERADRTLQRAGAWHRAEWALPALVGEASRRTQPAHRPPPEKAASSGCTEIPCEPCRFGTRRLGRTCARSD